jgi:phosphatidate cytidylyltransferase
MTWKRVATAAVLIPFVVLLDFKAPTGLMSVVLGIVILLAIWEFFHLGEAIGHRAYRIWTAVCAILLVYVQYLAAMDARYAINTGPVVHRVLGLLRVQSPTVADVFLVFLIGLTILTLATHRPLVEALPAAGISSSALLLVALPLTFAVRLHGVSLVGPYLLFFALVITWAGDTSAYFVGRAIGRHPFAPHLSPKKTWEGAVASFLGSILVALLAKQIGKVNMTAAHMMGMAATCNIGGQMGDLLESAYKRSAGVKDSGAMLPGHGGILDRIDALILAIPVVWYYWIWIYSRRV